MKILVGMLISITLMSAAAGAQMSAVQCGSRHFQLSVEPGLATLGLYEDISDNPWQLGFRTGMYLFVSDHIALGFGGRLSSMQFGERISYAYGFSIGPGMLIRGKGVADRHSVFVNIFTHLVLQYNRRNNRAGAEIGARVGGMKPAGGWFYAFGLAYDAIHDFDDGFRIFTNVGYSMARGLKHTDINKRTGDMLHLKRKGNLLHLSLESGLAGGGLYDVISNEGMQLGARAVLYTLLSHNAAIGLGSRFSRMQFGENYKNAYGYSAGPDMLIFLTSRPPQRDLFTNVFFHYMQQRTVNRFYSTGPTYGERHGIEVGMHFGWMKRAGGITYGFGFAYNAVNKYANGFRGFLTIGYGFHITFI